MSTEWKLVPVEPTKEMLAAPWSAGVNWRRLVEKANDRDIAPIYRAMLSAAPDAPAQPVVKVKALQWHDGQNWREAASPIGEYTIDGDEDEEMQHASWVCFGPEDCIGHFASRSEAEAAAQADYEARILSALEPAPSLSTRGEALLARAADEIESHNSEYKHRTDKAFIEELRDASRSLKEGK